MKEKKSIIFDIGNVLVRWSPDEIINLTFNDTTRKNEHIRNIFKSDIWYKLNLGEIDICTAKKEYISRFNYANYQIDTLIHYIKSTQIEIYQTSKILEKLYQENYKLYALTDNIIEVTEHLKRHYNFWKYFTDIIISAEVGLLKSDVRIFEYLINKHQFTPQNTIFIDDHKPNIDIAKSKGINTILFVDAYQLESDLRKFYDIKLIYK
ncbi:HAD family hydrolase [Acinetobacter nosocomialis]|uniref:HAD family hydrolase n=1 Tax=Acinetobacter nosocomialis TaxID=106654 RepID=UPI001F3983AE|nr:HAD family phosphatase [Acinetobacter nosocomialis]MCE7531667.1 HAD family phosphatase [Acinetobacter nosocomialis]